MTKERRATPAKEPAYEVLSPAGETTITRVPAAPRLDTLNGKTICELSSNMYNAHVSFPIIRELLKKQYPAIKIVPYEEMNKGLPGNTVKILTGDVAEQEEKGRAAVATARANGCDAVIVGNGG